MLTSVVFIGYLMDLIGRKKFIVGGLLMVCIFVFIKPMFKNENCLYTFRIFTNLGLIPMLYTPYTIDFVRSKSLGLLMGYNSMIAAFSSVIFGSGLV